MEARLDEAVHESHQTRAEKLLTEVKQLYHKAEEKAKEQAKAADRVVREHPYQTVGVAFGIGILIGVLVARRR